MEDQQKNLLIIKIVMTILVVLMIGTLGWVTYRYLDLKHNFDSKADKMVTTAVVNKTNELEASFIEREKQPLKQFVGPDDLGRLSFAYPKTWSVYIAQEKVGGDYQAYLHPKKIRPITKDSRYALRLTIENKEYENVIKKYDNLVKKGELKSDVTQVDGVNATRLEGAFSKIITGTAIIFKLRDKTVTIRTDADQVFRNDFREIIKSITFNK